MVNLLVKWQHLEMRGYFPMVAPEQTIFFDSPSFYAFFTIYNNQIKFKNEKKEK